jgi:hypothetical protein
MDLSKILTDDKEEDFDNICPVHVWADWFLEHLRETKGKVIFRMTTKELHENYLNWCLKADAEEYFFNIQSFGVRLTKANLPEIRTILTNKCSMRQIDLTDKAEEAMMRYRAQRTARAKGVEKA